MQDWTEIVRQLEKRLGFLHQIDRQILDDTIRLEDICSSVLRDIISFLMADIGYIYISSGTDLQILASSEPINNYIISTFETELLAHIGTSPFIVERLDSNDTSRLPLVGKKSRLRILLPISPGGSFWGLLCFETSQDDSSNPFENEDVQEFFQIVRGQLEIAIQVRSQFDEILQLSRLQNELFTKELDISDSLNSIVKNIILSLPSSGPFQIIPHPEVQILFYQEGEEYLSIKATSGKELINTRLLVSQSISGLLVEDRNLPFFLCDPTAFPTRYRSYLGKDETGIQQKQIRTELVLPLRYENNLIGVLNLESEIPNAFKVIHIESLQRLASKVSPIINALQSRILKMQVQDRASVYALNRFLNRFAATYNHKIVTPINNVRLNLETLGKKINKEGELKEALKIYLLEKVKTCIDAVDLIDDYHEKFSKDLPGYLVYSKFHINELIEGAVQDLRPDTLKTKYNIEVEFKPGGNYEVFCSLFLREHIFNILNNSAYAILERRKVEAQHNGRILIETFLNVDEQQRALNQRCIIKVLDNGIGLEKNKLANIPTPNFSTKISGTGFGLFSAYQYLKGIGGTLEVDSERNQFFEVKMIMDLYVEGIHSVIDTISSIK